jgi:RND family efflux transporter MFP subunit
MPAPEAEDITLTHTVSRMDLTDTVIERGRVESQSTVEGICRLHGYANKITYIVEEGAHVKDGEVVVRFDSSEIEKELIEERIALTKAQAAVDEATEQIEVQKNQNESDIASAELAKTLAELDLKKYEQGDYEAELADIDRGIAESKAALSQKQDQLKNMRVLVKKGFREPEQVRQLEQEVVSARFQVERDEQKKDVLVNFDKGRKLTELQFNAAETGRKLERAKATAKANLAKADLKLAASKEELKYAEEEVEEEEEQLEYCEIVASQAGTVAYANNRWMDQQFRVRPGGSIHRRQTVFHLPDMSRMQVELEFHESIINKLKIGKTATIRVDAFPDDVLYGRVEKISDLARSDTDSDTQNYTGYVTIDSFPSDLKLKPGMTAETEILIRKLEDVIAVPVQAVTEHLGTDYAYVRSPSGFKRTKIKIEAGNESYIIVANGLNEGDEVAMDAYQRGLDDFGTSGEDTKAPSDFESEESDDGSNDDDPQKEGTDDDSQVGKTSEELEIDNSEEEQEENSETNDDATDAIDSLQSPARQP